MYGFVHNFVVNGKGDSPYHFTCEAVEQGTSMRWARTYFLHNGIKNYMKDIQYTHKTDPIKGMATEKTEKAVDLLQVLYTELISTFASPLCSALNARQLKSIAAAEELVAGALLKKAKETNAEWADCVERKNVAVQLIGYNCSGELVDDIKETIPGVKDWSLYVLRIEVTHIKLYIRPQ